jgi:hypothetical protein
MRTLVIRNYLEDVTDENLGTLTSPWFKVDRGSFSLTNTVRYTNIEGTVRDLIRAGRRKLKFHSHIRNGYRTKYAVGFGVRSYQLVTSERDINNGND